MPEYHNKTRMNYLNNTQNGLQLYPSLNTGQWE